MNRFAGMGAVVVGGAEHTIKTIRDRGGHAIAVRLDQANEDEVAALIQKAVKSFGGLNILVNNAAKLAGDFIRRDRDVLAKDGDYWDEVMRNNLKGSMLTCKHAIPHVIAAGYGSIVNTGSGVVVGATVC